MIQTEGLGKQFGDLWAVNGIDLDVAPGQVLALLGQNGAGKTTTIRMLSSLLVPTRGRARVMGYDTEESPEEVRASVGVLTEQHGLYLRMTGAEYLAFFGDIYALDPVFRKKRTGELLEYFQLEAVADSPIGQYSKGMRQKLALARSLLHQPPVLLLDEPTSAMDPESALLVRNAISRLRSDDRTILLCTHNLAEAEMLADFVAIIYKGRIIAQDTIAGLKERFLGPAEFTVHFTGETPHTTLEIPGGILLLETGTDFLRFQTSDRTQNNPILLEEMMKKGYKVIQVEEAHQTLEQAYLTALKPLGLNEN